MDENKQNANTEQPEAETPTADDIIQLSRLAAAMRTLLLLCAPKFSLGSEADMIIQAANGSIQLITKCMNAKGWPK